MTRHLRTISLVAAVFSGCWDQAIHATKSVGPAEVDGPAAWYPLSDPDDPGRDRSGHDFDALPVGFVVLPDARRGFVAHFDGGALVMRVVVRRDFTVTLWLKTEQMGPDMRPWVAGPRIVDADVPGSSAIDFGFSVALDKLAYGVGNPTDATADATPLRSQRPVVDGTWHHVAVTRNGDTGVFQIFVDGVFDSERQGVTGDLMLPPVVNLGDLGNTSPASPPLRADLSDVRFYDRVLGVEGIAFLAANGEP